MSDYNDLVRRLNGWSWHDEMHGEAADAIKALRAELALAEEYGAAVSRGLNAANAERDMWRVAAEAELRARGAVEADLDLVRRDAEERVAELNANWADALDQRDEARRLVDALQADLAAANADAERLAEAIEHGYHPVLRTDSEAAALAAHRARVGGDT